MTTATIQRDRGAALIAARLEPDALVIVGLGTTSRVWRGQRAPHLSYYVSDPMGLAMPLALGLALTRPERNVAFLAGDGDFILSLSTLLTVAGTGVKNLRMIVFHNARYETGGGQPLPGSGKVSLAAMGRAAGLSWSEEASNEVEAKERVDELLGQPGPSLLVLHTAAEASPYPPAARWSQAEDRAVFMRRLAGEL